MDCLSTNCTVSGNDRMVSCWLCLGSFHLKCTSLKARDADAIADTGKSLQWTCQACKKVNIEFYKFFKAYRSEFEQLNRDFSSLQSKLTKFGELFTNFSNLDKFIDDNTPCSSKSKEKATKLPMTSCVNSSSGTTAASKLVHIDGIDSASSAVINTAASQQLSIPLVEVDGEPANLMGSPILSNSVGTKFNNLVVYKPLQAVPPRKSIFVSRLASDTSTDDIKYYINSKFGNDIDVVIQKFKFSTPRSISSFKISVTPNHFNDIIDPRFWPVNTLVREFTIRERDESNKVGIIPQMSQNVAKN